MKEFLYKKNEEFGGKSVFRMNSKWFLVLLTLGVTQASGKVKDPGINSFHWLKKNYPELNLSSEDDVVDESSAFGIQFDDGT